MKRSIPRLILLLLFALPLGTQANDNFDILKKAKKIVFFGDSITYGGEYVVFFERWLPVNHPELSPGLPGTPRGSPGQSALLATPPDAAFQ